jgi:tmRNA-binding protein
MPFPAVLSFLLNNESITTDQSDLDEGFVVYTEGDIFLINVDGFEEQSVPKISIARQGS